MHRMRAIALKTIIRKPIANDIFPTTWRTFAARPKNRSTQQFRRDDLEARRTAYDNHPQLLYSSHLELTQLDGRKEAVDIAADPFGIAGTAFGEQIKDLGKEFFSELNAIKSATKYPKNWMHDYEHYDEELWPAETTESLKNGTEDPKIPPSSVPCSGCGAKLHCNRALRPGYIPREIFAGRKKEELQTIICQRCHFLKHYNIALDVEVTPQTYIDTIARIRDQFALAIVMVNLVDFPCSIWPGLAELLGPKRPVFIVGNKVDLLPRDSSRHLQTVKQSLSEQVVRSGFNRLNIKHVALISAKTGFGVEELITQLHNIWRYKGDVYLMGCTNVGKSSLFNILLNSDYCRPEASKLVRAATTCPWPGTTLQMLRFPILRPSQIRIYQRFKRLFSERSRKAAQEKLRRDQAQQLGSIAKATLVGSVGRTFLNPLAENYNNFSMAEGVEPITTLNERGADYKAAKWCYDTPGVMHPDQITDLLTAEELERLEAKEMIRPRGVRLYAGTSLFIGGLARLDFLGASEQSRRDWLKIVVFASSNLPLAVTRTDDADEFYMEYLGTDILGIPARGDPTKRPRAWPDLEAASEVLTITGERDSDLNGLTCDVMLSSAGWIGMTVDEGDTCTFRAWTPSARGIHVRKPPLIPFVESLIGKHVRNSLAYNTARPFTFRKPSGKIKSD